MSEQGLASDLLEADRENQHRDRLRLALWPELVKALELADRALFLSIPRNKQQAGANYAARSAIDPLLTRARELE